MKYFYLAISINENGKKYAYIRRISHQDNIANMFKNTPVEIATIRPTKKDAIRVVNHWNAVYIANNCHLFETNE